MLAASVQIAGCPETIRDTQSAVADKTWSVRIENRARNLERVTIYSGNPSRRRSLLGEFVGKKACDGLSMGLMFGLSAGIPGRLRCLRGILVM